MCSDSESSRLEKISTDSVQTDSVSRSAFRQEDFSATIVFPIWEAARWC